MGLNSSARLPRVRCRSWFLESRHHTAAVGDPRRIFGAHAAHLRRCVFRSSLTQRRLRSLRCSAAPTSWTTWSPNLSPRTPPVAVVDERRLREVALTTEEYRA